MSPQKNSICAYLYKVQCTCLCFLQTTDVDLIQCTFTSPCDPHTSCATCCTFALQLHVSPVTLNVPISKFRVVILNVEDREIGRFRLHAAFRSILELVIVDAQFDYTKSDKFRR